jgi:hypothetical protein
LAWYSTSAGYCGAGAAGGGHVHTGSATATASLPLQAGAGAASAPAPVRALGSLHTGRGQRRQQRQAEAASAGAIGRDRQACSPVHGLAHAPAGLRPAPPLGRAHAAGEGGRGPRGATAPWRRCPAATHVLLELLAKDAHVGVQQVPEGDVGDAGRLAHEVAGAALVQEPVERVGVGVEGGGDRDERMLRKGPASEAAAPSKSRTGQLRQQQHARRLLAVQCSATPARGPAAHLTR